MTAKFFWRAEGSTLDGVHDFSAGDTTATANGAVAISAAQAFRGTNSVFSQTAGDYYSFAIAPPDLWDDAAWSIGFAFRFEAWAADALFFRLTDVSATNNQVHVVTIGSSGSGNIRLRIGQTGGAETDITLTGNQIALSTWYGCVCRGQRANQLGRIELYNASQALIDSAENLAVPLGHFPLNSQIDELRIGLQTLAPDVHIDQVVIGSSYADPAETWLGYSSYTQISGSALARSVARRFFFRGVRP